MSGFRKNMTDLIRPALKSPPGMTKELVEEIDRIFDEAGVKRDDGSPPKAKPKPGAPFRRQLTDLLRPLLAKPPGLTQELVDGLDAIWLKCGVPKDGEAPKPAAAKPKPAASGGTRLRDEAAFFAALKTAFRAFNPSQRAGTLDILAGCGAAKWGVAFTANALGTAWLETAEQMQPVHEAFWVKQPGRDAYYRKMYDIEGQRPKKARELGNDRPGDGIRYHGRGYPQTTGRNNYKKAEDHFGLPFVAEPDLIMDAKVAAQVMVWGMETGGFTGLKLGKFLPAAGPGTAEQHKQARKVINGSDRWEDLSAFSMKFQKALQAGGWG